MQWKYCFPCVIVRFVLVGVDLKVFVGDNADKILLLRGWRGVYLWYKPHRVATGK